MKTKILAILNLVSVVLHICFSWLSQSRALSVNDVGQVSAKYESLFTPSGQTFAIWGLIYLSLLAFCVFHVVKAFNEKADHIANAEINSIGCWFILNNIATIAWLLAWVNEELLVSMVLIMIQLFTLIRINIAIPSVVPDRPYSNRLLTDLPLSIYFGWITIATIANASAFLVSLPWNGWGISAIYWTIIIIGVAALVSLFIILLRRNLYFGLPILWALYGIAQKREEAGGAGTIEIQTAVWAAFVLVCLALMIRLQSIIKSVGNS